MQIKDKRTGKLIEPDGFTVNGPGFTMSMETFAEQYEIVEAEKPFEEVAEAPFSVIYSGVNNKDKVAYGKGIIKIADRDYYEILPDGTKKTEFTWDEAMDIEKKTNGKWRLPTEQEWYAICAAFGRNEDGRITGKALAKSLNLASAVDGHGAFWSRTADSSTSAQYLNFNIKGLAIPHGSNYKVDGISVRLVRGDEE